MIGRDKFYRQGNSTLLIEKLTAIQVSPDSDSIMYVASSTSNVVQKVSLTGNNTLTQVTLAGRKKDAENTASAGALSAAEVNLFGSNSFICYFYKSVGVR